MRRRSHLRQGRVLTGEDLQLLFTRVFALTPEDRLAFLVEVPSDLAQDNDQWKWLRETAAEWRCRFPKKGRPDGRRGLVDLWFYPSTGSSNLPEHMAPWNWRNMPGCLDETVFLNWPGRELTEKVLRQYSVFVAMTWNSITRQLKAMAGRFGFRCATMPGFTQEMVPALFLDYGEVGRRVRVLHELLEQAEEAGVVFIAREERYKLTLDLRFNKAQASTGHYPNPGDGGNLPTGEAYIAPYLGQRHPAIPSRTRGFWPVMFKDGLVVFKVGDGGWITSLSGKEPALARERQLLADEDGFCWLAELGLGVLGEMGVEPVGEVLLDEKLGLHIARGESASGGEITAENFKNPRRADHQDFVYTGDLQRGVEVASLVLIMADGSSRVIMENDRYVEGLFS